MEYLGLIIFIIVGLVATGVGYLYLICGPR